MLYYSPPCGNNARKIRGIDMRKLYALLAAATMFAAAPAAADICQFNLAGAVTEPGQFNGSPLTAVFQLNCTPVPTRTDNGAFPRFDVDGVTGVFNGPGVAGNNGMGVGPIAVGDLNFYTGPAGGGFGVNNPNDGDFGLFSLEGPQLFSGTLNSPAFTPGTYAFTNDFYYGAVRATLTITQLSAPGVPEPATWAMLIMGFGAMGAAMRRRTVAVEEAQLA